MSDIVERLRKSLPTEGLWTLRVGMLVDEAADEIERLRADMREIASQCHNLPRSATADRIDQIARRALDGK